MTIENLFGYVGLLSLFITSILYFLKLSNKNIIINYLKNFLGIIFIFSGMVKAIDPLGTAYKMHDYFGSFAQDGFSSFWQSLEKYDFVFALLMIIFEIVLGFSLIIGWKSKFTTICMFLMNIFFLVLIGYSFLSGYCVTIKSFVTGVFFLLFIVLASIFVNEKNRKKVIFLSVLALISFLLYCKISDSCLLCDFDINKIKVKDCGCFGDFMKLKPIKTFTKDIILSIISLILLINYKKITTLFSSKNSNILVLGVFIVSSFICFYNSIWTLPVIDFRPFKIGSDINENLKVIKPDSVQFEFIYKNSTTGEVKTFEMNNIPTDTNWQYVERKDKIIEEGIPAKIDVLRFENTQGENITNLLLNDEDTTYWIICYDLTKTNIEVLKSKFLPFAKKMKSEGKKVYFMTSLISDKEKKDFGNDFEYVISDATKLKTMIRANPGIMTIKKGKVLDLKHWRFLK